MTTADSIESIEREAKSLRVPMTHVAKDDEYLDVLAYRIDQQLAHVEKLRALRDRVEALRTTPYERACETLRELEVELGTTLRLGYIGNLTPTRDDRSWDVCFADLAVSKSETNGRGPWSHRASGMSYPSTRSWSTSEFPTPSELASLVRDRFAREQRAS